MKKLILIPISLLFIGCLKQENIDKKIESNQKDFKLLNQYHTTKRNLHKFNNSFIFLNLANDGSLKLFQIDNNYDLITSKNLNLIITPIKLKTKNNKIYILGFSQIEKQAILIILNNKGEIIKKTLIGNKYDSPTDILIDDRNIIITLNTYSKKNKTDIVIIKNSIISKKISTKFAEESNIITKFKNGYLICGNILQNNQNAFIIYVDKHFNIIWSKEFDFGLDERINNIKIIDNKIILDIISENYTGQEEKYDITLDENGKILNKNKTFEIKNYPLKFQG